MKNIIEKEMLERYSRQADFKNVSICQKMLHICHT